MSAHSLTLVSVCGVFDVDNGHMGLVAGDRHGARIIVLHQLGLDDEVASAPRSLVNAEDLSQAVSETACAAAPNIEDAFAGYIGDGDAHSLVGAQRKGCSWSLCRKSRSDRFLLTKARVASPAPGKCQTGDRLAIRHLEGRTRDRIELVIQPVEIAVAVATDDAVRIPSSQS